MSTCITKQMWNESILAEKKRLKALESDGFDIDKAWSDLEQLDKGWNEQNAEAIVNVLANTNVENISSFTISEFNNNKPKLGKTRVTVVSGYISDGKPVYNVKYPNSEKEYTVKGSRLTADQFDPMLSRTLGASVDDNFNIDDYDLEVDGALDSEERAHALIDRLSELDAVEDTEEHLQELKGFLSIFTGKGYSEAVKTYIKTKQDRNKGKFVFDTLTEKGAISIAVGTATRQTANEMSAASKWVHEVGHALTEFALRRDDPETRPTIRRLRHLREEARKVLTVEMLMPKNSIDAIREKEMAKELYNYMFNNTDSGLSEFLVHSVTNKEVKEALKNVTVYKQQEAKANNLFERVIQTVSKLIDTIMAKVRREQFDITGDELAVKLMNEIARANNKAAKIKREASIIDKVYDTIGNAEDKLRITLEKYTEALEKKGLPIPPTGAGKLAFAKWAVKTMPHMLGDKRLKVAYEALLSAFGAKPEQSIQTWLRNLSETDSLGMLVEQLDALSQQIDSRREVTEAVVEKQIVEAFKDKLSIEEMEALTLVGIQADLEVVFKNYDKDKLVSMLRESKVLMKEIDKKRKELEKLAANTRDYNWYINQANGLGYFMATYVANENQNMNAENIAKGFGRAVQKAEVSGNLVKLIDELATLEAVRYNSKAQKEALAKLISKDYDGVANTIGVHRTFKEESKLKLFYGDTHRVIKGFSKEIFNADIDVQIRPMTEKIELAKQGYRLEKELGDKKGMGIFISNDKSLPAYNKQSVRLTDSGRKGTSINDIFRMEGGVGSKNSAKTAINYASISMLKMSKAQESSLLDIDREDAEWGLSPMFDAKGKAVDFRYMMNKATKRTLLDQDLRAPKVLGRMLAGIQDKVETADHNAKVYEAIVEDMKENYEGRTGLYGRNGKEYIKITANSTNDEIADLWKILPDGMKESFTNTEGGIFVRRDMLHMYFGNRDFSLAYTKYGKMLPTQVQHLVRAVELLWIDLISLIKVDIIIKTPAVIIGNVVSNFLYGIMTGNSPLEVLKLQLDAIKDMREFMNMNKELIELEIAAKSGNVKGKDLGRIGVLKEDISKHPMREFASEGLFQAIIEDVGLNEFKTKDRITGKIQEKLESMPRVKTTLDWVFLTEKTGFFKAITAATQLSDAAARKAKMDLDKRSFDKLVNRGVSKREALKRVFLVDNAMIDSMLKKGNSWGDIYKKITIQSARTAFINYSGEDRLTKYANNLGLVMFTKYAQRIQKVIRKNAIQHPLHFMMAILGQNFLTGELDTIDDKFASMPYSPDYLDKVINLVVPASFDIGNDLYKMAT